MKKIIFTRPDGGLSIVTPAINTHPQIEQITEADALARAMERLPADALNVRVVEEANIPTDRTYRNAWQDTGSGAVTHDMSKARELQKARLRELRAPKLAALDVAYMRADERGDAAEKIRIAAQKQALRDVTADPAIEEAKTPEELKAVIPSALA